jgi:hypothetical protein
LQDDRAELALDADDIARAFREADAFEPGAGETDLGDFATRGDYSATEPLGVRVP